ncbi:unnamed protein product [Closterium sp. NIES-65]|nr:unnamed protein product [Closterium sp. NIES-65]
MGPFSALSWTCRPAVAAPAAAAVAAPAAATVAAPAAGAATADAADSSSRRRHYRGRSRRSRRQQEPPPPQPGPQPPTAAAAPATAGAAATATADSSSRRRHSRGRSRRSRRQQHTPPPQPRPQPPTAAAAAATTRAAAADSSSRRRHNRGRSRRSRQHQQPLPPLPGPQPSQPPTAAAAAAADSRGRCRRPGPALQRGAAVLCRPVAALSLPARLRCAPPLADLYPPALLFQHCDRKGGLSLFDLTSGASAAPAADANSTIRSQRATRDAAARLAVRSHLPSSERAHFSHYKSARTLYDAVVTRYSSPATTALSRLMLPYLFPDLAAFPTVADLITHLRTSDTRYRAALPAEFCAKNPPPMGAPPPPFNPLLPLLLPSTSFAPSQSALRLPLAGDAAPARARGARALEGLAGAVEVAVEAAEGVVVAVGVLAGVGASVAAVEAEAAAAVAVGAEEEAVAAVADVAAAEVELVGVAPRSGAASVVVSASSSSALVRPRPPQQLREWYAARQRGGGAGPCAYVLRTDDRTGEPCGGPHTTQRSFGRFTDAWRLQFPDATEIPRWGELLRSGVAIFDLDYDAILAAMYVVSTSDEGDCYLCVPLNPGIEAAALGAGEAAALGASASAAPGTGAFALSGTTSAQALHTFTLDSGASRSFFRDRTTLTPLSRPVAVSLADPSRGPVLAHFSTVLPCPAAPSGTLSGLYLPLFSMNLVSGADLQDGGVDQFTPASQRVTHCTCARTGRHLATFTRQPGSSLYTLTT